MKALGLGLGAFGFHDAWVEVEPSGAPRLVVTGRARELAVDRGVVRWHLSLSHDGPVAVAIVGSPSDGLARDVIPIVTPEEMAAIDAAAPEPVEVLIERAGSAVARMARQMLGGTYGPHGQRHRRQGQQRQRRACRGAHRSTRARRAGAHVRRRRLPAALPDADLVIDAAYGTGFRGEWRAPRVGAAPVLAVDIPSGVDGLTGEAGRGVLAADRTVTFAALKPGLLLAAGRDLAGDVEVVDIGLDTGRARAHLVEADDVAAWWRPRPPTAHKWSRAVRVVAGSPGMTGAAHLAAGAAQRAGSGMVPLSSPGVEADGAARGRAPPAAGVRLVRRPCSRTSTASTPWSSGPASAGRSTPSRPCGRPCRQAPVPVVVDGDGLFALAWDPDGAGAAACAGATRRPCSRRTTASTACSPGTGPTPTASAPSAGWPPTCAPSCC